MGKNKQLRKRMAGQLRVISTHEKKIESELRMPVPDMGYIRKWKREIDTARNNMRKLEEKLEK
jgi:predicted  nucleic acid-binding Zn-ribbon protein